MLTPDANRQSRRRFSAGFRLATILAIAAGCSLPLPSASAQDATGETDALSASTLTVNVELILDASGSMAELIPGTERQTRMDAAREAMRDVIARIPEREGLHVGFRIYGHEGSNSEADRPVSCQATELLVPLAGVDKDALLAQVDTFQPTGWTPLALALEGAAGDFTPGGESVTNAIIMVTDGEDTCGGDPCAVARSLHEADIALTTHVVGFALTRKQRQAVRCIAEEGGGQLFAAEDAASLSDAVFTAFTQVEATPPVETVTETELRGYVGGNAFSLLPAGDADALSVVAVGAYDGSHLPIVVENATGEDVEGIQVSTIARVDGELIATGTDQGLSPRIVVAGGLAFGDVYFGDDLPEDVTFEFEVSAAPAAEDEATTRDLIVAEVNGTDTAVIGILRNPHAMTIGQPVVYVNIACFDESGQLLDVGYGQANKTAVDPDATTPFEHVLPNMAAALETETGPRYLVTGNGNALDP